MTPIKITIKPPCPTLAAIDRVIEQEHNKEPQRTYLGMSQIGNWCERSLWYYFRIVSRTKREAAIIKSFIRGHRAEDVQAGYLKRLPAITLHEVDPDTGKQWAYSDVKKHFWGHSDGKIIGVIQAPKTWHIWEHKEVDEKKFDKLNTLRTQNEKAALLEWDDGYYAQAQCYMHYAGLKRHFLTCSKNGVRQSISIRTDYNAADALKYIEKADRIINSVNVPRRPLGATVDFYKCGTKWCDHHDVCWQRKMPSRNCRTCLHSTPVDDGKWHCAKHGKELDRAVQRQRYECHRFIPSLIPIKQVDVDGDNVVYEFENGSKWIDDGKD